MIQAKTKLFFPFAIVYFQIFLFHLLLKLLELVPELLQSCFYLWIAAKLLIFLKNWRLGLSSSAFWVIPPAFSFKTEFTYVKI